MSATASFTVIAVAPLCRGTAAHRLSDWYTTKSAMPDNPICSAADASALGDWWFDRSTRPCHPKRSVGL
jgi:hypothetical protein